MESYFSRREFLKVSALSLLAPMGLPQLFQDSLSAPLTGRVTRKSLKVYAEADLNSPVVGKVERDDLLTLHEQVTTSGGLNEGVRWYRLEAGFIQSAYIQRIERAYLNKPLTRVPVGGQLAEVTVPYAKTWYKNRKGQWMRLYRLYYQSVHWITDLVETPVGGLMYELTDEWLKARYYVSPRALRPISAEELAPLSPDVPESEKRIEIQLDSQQLTAYEGNQIVLQCAVSTGKRYMETPKGDFQVNRKHPSKHMGDGGLTSNIHAYELVGVPWVSFFTQTGIALHGTFWHDHFGHEMSQGCVNLPNADAKWLFRWCAPHFSPDVQDCSEWKLLGNGTTITVY